MVRRRQVALGVAVLALPVLSALLLWARPVLDLTSGALLFLLLVVVIALIGGALPAVVTAVAATLILNFFFTEPTGRFSIAEANDALALFVFVTVAALVSSVVDLAARRAEREHRSAKESQFLAALLTAAGHDLRSPLASATVAVTALRSPAVNRESDRAELLESADASLGRLAHLVGDLLDLSRLQAGALAVVPRLIALDELVPLALDELGTAGDAIVCDVPESLPLIETDPGLLQRVLVNLLQNALRHAPGRAPDLLAQRAQDDDAVELLVIDHGPGIPAADRERMFAPFQQLRATDTTTGLGLGLAVARGLTEALGGTLAPQATRGGGLTMVVRLPLPALKVS